MIWKPSLRGTRTVFKVEITDRKLYNIGGSSVKTILLNHLVKGLSLKNLIRKIFFAKLGAGVISGIVAYRSKKQAESSVEQSDYFRLIQRIKTHPLTHRSDGFYKVVYRFQAELGEHRSIEAKVTNYRPIDKLVVKDGLEIQVKLKERLLKVSQEIQKRPLIDQALIPDIVRRKLPGLLYIEQEGTDSELAEAYDILGQALSVNER